MTDWLGALSPRSQTDIKQLFNVFLGEWRASQILADKMRSACFIVICSTPIGWWWCWSGMSICPTNWLARASIACLHLPRTSGAQYVSPSLGTYNAPSLPLLISFVLVPMFCLIILLFPVTRSSIYPASRLAKTTERQIDTLSADRHTKVHCRLLCSSLLIN